MNFVAVDEAIRFFTHKFTAHGNTLGNACVHTQNYCAYICLYEVQDTMYMLCELLS